MKTTLKILAFTFALFIGISYILEAQDGRLGVNRLTSDGKLKLYGLNTNDNNTYDATLTILSDTGLVIVNPRINKRRDTWAELIDSACIRFRFTPTGKPIIIGTGPTGTDYFNFDSTAKLNITGNLSAGNTTLSNLTASNVTVTSSGAFNILGRWTQGSSADGVFTQSN